MPSDEELAAFLGGHPPFEALDTSALDRLTQAASVAEVAPGTVVLDAFAAPSTEVFVVLDGEVDLWNYSDALDDIADERLGAGGVFGYSAMLTRRSVGPRAVTVGPATLIRIPGTSVTPAFSSRPGARFLAEHLSSSPRRPAAAASYGLVDELVVSDPVCTGPDASVHDVARLMSEHGSGYAAIALGDGRFGLVTDALLRDRVLVHGETTAAAARMVMDERTPVAHLGDSATEALITLMDSELDYLLVLDAAGRLHGAVTARDFVVSPATAGVSLRERMRRARNIEELVALGAAAPEAMSGLLAQGLASGRVITIHSATVDACVRRALQLVFALRPELSIDAFTWLSLGSNGRREAVPASDVDAAVAFATELDGSERARYRAAFAEVEDVLTRAGFGIDRNGATPRQEPFARTNNEWRAAAEHWLADPVRDQGAIMTSLLVDARPIHGDPGLPAVTEVFTELRRHPATMRLLLTASLSRRARLRSVRDVMAGRGGTFDLKAHALVPIINIARWSALSVGATNHLSTTERLRAAAGSPLLTADHVTTLVEVFEVLQRLRLRHQLAQVERGETPSDVLTMQLMSPIDRSVIAQAVREISTVQRAMANAAHYVPSEEWGTLEP